MLCLDTSSNGRTHASSTVAGGQNTHHSAAQTDNLICPTCLSLQVLAQPFHLDRKGEVPAGKQETYQTPVFTFSDGQLSVNYSRPFLETASRHPGVPDWTPEQVRRFGEVAIASKTPTRRCWSGIHCISIPTAFEACIDHQVSSSFDLIELTAPQREALELVEEVAGSPDLALHYNLEPGTSHFSAACKQFAGSA